MIYIILIIIGLIIFGGYKIMSLNKEDKELNRDLENYKESMKERRSMGEFIKEEVKNAKERSIVKVAFVKGKNDKYMDVTHLVKLTSDGIEKVAVSMLGSAKDKVLEKIQLSEIKNVEISLINENRTRGWSVHPKWDYEGKTEESLEKFCLALGVSITKTNGVSEKFLISNVRAEVPFFMEWANRVGVEVEDREGLAELIAKLPEGELYNYYKQNPKHGDLGIKYQERVYED